MKRASIEGEDLIIESLRAAEPWRGERAWTSQKKVGCARAMSDGDISLTSTISRRDYFRVFVERQVESVQIVGIADNNLSRLVRRHFTKSLVVEPFVK